MVVLTLCLASQSESETSNFIMLTYHESVLWVLKGTVFVVSKNFFFFSARGKVYLSAKVRDNMKAPGRET